MLERFLFLDTETTGTDVKEDSLVQVAFVLDDSEYIDVGLFNPGKDISIEAMSVTHITNKMVKDCPTFKSSTMKDRLQNFLNDGFILVAHNARFDIAMLEKEGVTVPKYICTLKNAYRKYPNAPKHTLQYLRYWLDLDVVASSHDAASDVKVLRKFFKLMSLDAEEAIKISKEPIIYSTIPFGKYKGTSLKDIAKIDRGYLDWLLREKKKDNDEDWIFTITEALKS